ncbi:MAG: hypothetical protein JSU82_14680 [Rhodospirillales bacterium]|nr:MAG: hypothetical protein JSU82_14680 [Rhodospirillales bacterium]
MLDLSAAAAAADGHGHAVVSLARMFLLIESLLAGRQLRFGLPDLLFDLFERSAKLLTPAGRIRRRRSGAARTLRGLRHAIKRRMEMSLQLT